MNTTGLVIEICHDFSVLGLLAENFGAVVFNNTNLPILQLSSMVGFTDQDIFDLVAVQTENYAAWSLSGSQLRYQPKMGSVNLFQKPRTANWRKRL